MSLKIKKEAWEEIARMKEKAAKKEYNRDRIKSRRFAQEAKDIRAKHNC